MSLYRIVRYLDILPKSSQGIPRKGNSKTGNDDIDWSMYRYRHLEAEASFTTVCIRYIVTMLIT